MGKDLYNELGVNKDVSQKDLEKAYKDKAKEVHPDKNGGDTKKMQELNNAYAVLKNPSRRSRYDETGDETETPFDLKFADLVQTIFIQVIDRTENIEGIDMIGRLVDMIEEIIKGGVETKEDLSAKIVKLNKVLVRLEKKGSDDSILVVLQNNVFELKRQIAVTDEQVEFMNKSLEIVRGYSYKFEKPAPIAPNRRHSFFEQEIDMGEQYLRDILFKKPY